MPCLTLRAVQLNPFSCKKSYIVECSANFVTIEAFLTMCAAWCVLLCPALCIFLLHIVHLCSLCNFVCFFAALLLWVLLSNAAFVCFCLWNAGLCISLLLSALFQTNLLSSWRQLSAIEDPQVAFDSFSF